MPWVVEKAIHCACQLDEQDHICSNSSLCRWRYKGFYIIFNVSNIWASTIDQCKINQEIEQNNSQFKMENLSLTAAFTGLLLLVSKNVSCSLLFVLFVMNLPSWNWVRSIVGCWVMRSNFSLLDTIPRFNITHGTCIKVQWIILCFCIKIWHFFNLLLCLSGIEILPYQGIGLNPILIKSFLVFLEHFLINLTLLIQLFLLKLSLHITFNLRTLHLGLGGLFFLLDSRLSIASSTSSNVLCTLKLMNFLIFLNYSALFLAWLSCI